VHWIVPILAGVPFGLGVVLVFSGVWTFLVAAFPAYAASAMAANTFSRCVFAAGFPLFSIQMYDKLGLDWASALLAFIVLAMVPLPFLFFKFGPKLRSMSRFAAN